MDSKEIEEIKAKIKTLEELQEKHRVSMIELTSEIIQLKNSICTHKCLSYFEDNVYRCQDCSRLVEVK